MGVRIPKAIIFLLDALFPPRCLACKRLLRDGDTFLCATCRSSVFVFDAPQCPKCGGRLPDMRPRCHRDAGYLVFAAGKYGDAGTRELIHALKYRSFEGAAIPLAHIIILHLENTSSFFDLIQKENFIAIPVPLHARKQRSRGFNQAERIANEVARLAETLGHSFPDLVKSALVRTRVTRSQTECDGAEERRRNIVGAFAVPNPETIRGKNILLFDDVFTSGATLDEAVATLKKSGAKKIFALVAAKA